LTKILTKLRQDMAKERLEAFLISTYENRLYVSGFSGSAGFLFITDSQLILVTDSRYTEQASIQAKDFTIKCASSKLDWLRDVIESTGVKRIGFEADDVTFNMHQALLSEVNKINVGKNKNIEMVATSNIVGKLRQYKTIDEIQILKKVCSITDQAMDVVTPTIEAGMTEKEVSWLLEQAMRNLGGEKMSFDVIVAAGANGALPHHRPDSSIIKSGDSVVIDMGCVYQNYCSDLTRTIVIDQPDHQFVHVYKTVLKAQIHAEAEARPGMSGAEIDDLARSVISDAGFGDQFGHSLGHGVGLEVHEKPWIAANSKNIIEPGMVFTIEPGIYIPGWGGVRIEDVVVMKETGVELLNKAKKMAF
tara:strand:+ start:1106 stop:2188 length:1083 start_codon:yes stop_codon:yes gene_type:complete